MDNQPSQPAGAVGRIPPTLGGDALAPHGAAVGSTHPGEMTKRIIESCRGFLRSLGQTVKLISLYKVNHPVPASSMQETWHALQDICSETGWKDVAVGLKEGHWIVNDAVIADSAQIFELMMIVFRTHGMQTVSFSSGVLLHELTAFCELASTPPNRIYETDAADYLKERGVKHIRVDVEAYVRARHVEPAAPANIPSPIPDMKARKPASANGSGPGKGGPGSAGKGFGSFIKGLVEEAIKDPQERAQIYGEAVRLVEQALSRHVGEATRRLQMEKQHVLNERIRTENVMAKVADGKVVVDSEGRVLMMDPTAEQIVGKQLVDVAGKPILDSINTAEQVVALSQDIEIPDHRMVSGDVKVAGGEEMLNTMRQSMALVQDQQGRLVGTYAVTPHVTKMREAIKMQEEFVSNITHDLKAPLTSICAALEVLKEKLGLKMDKDESNFLEISIRNSGVLKQMINEILDFSKIRSGKMTIRPAPTPVAPILKEAAEALTPWAQTKRIALEIAKENGEKLPKIHADRGRVVQVFTNLISNAIKFTPEGGRITVSARRGAERDYALGAAGREHDPSRGAEKRERTIVFAVQDTGCGISAEDQKRIFERFSQLAEGGARKEGVGLGLAITKELVSLHNGDLWLESDLDRGSTFYFSIPVA